VEIVVACLAVALVVALCASFSFWRKSDRMDTRFTHLDIEMSGLKDQHAAELTALKEKAAHDLKKAQAEPTFDCRELLHDLTEGAALVKITRISPMDVYLRRS
jgi:hypothetical protein